MRRTQGLAAVLFAALYLPTALAQSIGPGAASGAIGPGAPNAPPTAGWGAHDMPARGVPTPTLPGPPPATIPGLGSHDVPVRGVPIQTLNPSAALLTREQCQSFLSSWNDLSSEMQKDLEETKKQCELVVN
jgi:hypothetical protein